jgi:RNA polymerase sigma-70 factor (ECF subfamily)
MITPLDSPAATNSTNPPDLENGTARQDTAGTAVDKSLVRRFLAGDQGAFGEIVARHRRRILGVTLALLRNHADAEEVTQDTFIRVHRGLADFRGSSSFATWLYRIAVNLSHNRYWYYFRRRRQDSFSLDQAISPENTATLADLVMDGTPDPAREVMTREFATLVERCMQRLEARHREILVLRNDQGRSYDEIAVMLGINPGTVKSRIARARVNLRELLAEACPEFPRRSSLRDWFLPARPAGGQVALAVA